MPSEPLLKRTYQAVMPLECELVQNGGVLALMPGKTTFP